MARRFPNELRLEFSRVLTTLRQGRSLTLSYHNKPLARIVPIEQEHVLREDDPIYRSWLKAIPSSTI
jgi:antitoxin (DNA-binding transcriptional repressor) of toxin-antitoxin stability system